MSLIIQTKLKSYTAFAKVLHILHVGAIPTQRVYQLSDNFISGNWILQNTLNNDFARKGGVFKQLAELFDNKFYNNTVKQAHYIHY